MANSLTDLPPNVLTEILSRLPLRTLFLSKCVCKTFLHLSSPDNPQFTAMHSANASQILIFQFKEIMGLTPLYTIDPELDAIVTDVSQDSPKLGNNPYQLPLCTGQDYQLVNSCNGLIFLLGTADEAVICNPVTSEYIIIPGIDTGKSSSLWLGFCPSSKKYKVLKFNAPGVAEVLEIGSDSWRCIDNMNCRYDHQMTTCCTFFNESIYWMNLCTSKTLDYFNFESERFGVIDLPQSGGIPTNRIRVGVLQGCLCLSMVDPSCSKVVIWFLKHDNLDKYWNMGFVIDIPWNNSLSLKPLQILRNSEIVMQRDASELICYKVENKSLRFVILGDMPIHSNTTLIGDPMLHNLVILTPTVVSLKDILMMADNHVVKKSSEGWMKTLNPIFHGVPDFNQMNNMTCMDLICYFWPQVKLNLEKFEEDIEDLIDEIDRMNEDMFLREIDAHGLESYDNRMHNLRL